MEICRHVLCSDRRELRGGRILFHEQTYRHRWAISPVLTSYIPSLGGITPPPPLQRKGRERPGRLSPGSVYTDRSGAANKSGAGRTPATVRRGVKLRPATVWPQTTAGRAPSICESYFPGGPTLDRGLATGDSSTHNRLEAIPSFSPAWYGRTYYILPDMTERVMASCIKNTRHLPCLLIISHIVSKYKLGMRRIKNRLTIYKTDNLSVIL